MANIPVFAVFLLFLYAISLIYSRYVYKGAVSANRTHLERAKIHADMLALKFEFDAHCTGGGFSESAEIKGYVQTGMRHFFGIDYPDLDKIKFQSRLMRLPIEEFSRASELEKKLLNDYSDILERLCKVNQPAKYRLLSLKKIAQRQMLSLVVRFLIYMLEQREKALNSPRGEEVELVLVPRDAAQVA
ncbi:MAG: hypothetical protein FWD98_00175 [Defluviitaleaceae bacterium]|nr:hypothetical protein [Defluviitaleaceae bacterium]